MESHFETTDLLQLCNWKKHFVNQSIAIFCLFVNCGGENCRIYKRLILIKQK